jgi:hypothetical protein
MSNAQHWTCQPRRCLFRCAVHCFWPAYSSTRP